MDSQRATPALIDRDDPKSSDRSDESLRRMMIADHVSVALSALLGDPRSPLRFVIEAQIGRKLPTAESATTLLDLVGMGSGDPRERVGTYDLRRLADWFIDTGVRLHDALSDENEIGGWFIAARRDGLARAIIEATGEGEASEKDRLLRILRAVT